MIAKLPLVPFVIINLTRLTAGVCMKVRFKSKVTRGFSLLAASRLSRGSRKTSGTRVADRVKKERIRIVEAGQIFRKVPLGRADFRGQVRTNRCKVVV